MKLFFSLCALLCMIVTYGDTDNAYQQSPPPTKQCYMAVNEAYVSWYLKRHGIDIDPSLYAIPVTGAIQGHPEAGRLWQDFIVSFLTGPKLKFTTTGHERNLYCGTFHNERILVCRQVDDFAIGSTTTATAEALIQVINSHAITSSNGIGALVQLWSRYGSDNTVREDTAGIVRIFILYLYVDKKIFIRIQNDLR
jgi:hypothetical protein